MHPCFSDPLLTVDAEKIHKVDTGNAHSLHGMWMVFSKCKDYMEEGRRLENLSWRLWTRETFCVDPKTSGSSSALPSPHSEDSDLPELSVSIESASSDHVDRIEAHVKEPKGINYKPLVLREESQFSLGRGKEKHITSSGLERMVLNIKEKKDLMPLPPMTTIAPPVVDLAPRPCAPTPTPPSICTTKQTPPSYQAIKQHLHTSTESCSTAALEANDSDNIDAHSSNTSVSSSDILTFQSELVKSPSIVRGFSPSHISSSYRSQPKLSADVNATKTPTVKPSPFKKKGSMFTLGGSSGDDDESSFEDRLAMQRPHRSSLSDGLGKSAIEKSVTSNPDTAKTTTSVQETMKSSPIKSIKEHSQENYEDAVETEDEVSESAIEEEDSDWEDSASESGRSVVEEKEMFQRVDSRPNLISRRSLITMMMHQPAKMHGNLCRSSPALQRSRLTSPNGCTTPSVHEGDEENLMMRGPGVPRSKPIIVKPAPQSIAHSPRTTRRNMLATELTESLRRHLLWERQQKSATANAFLKRRHTAHDMANLQEYPALTGQPQRQDVSMLTASVSREMKDKDSVKNGSLTSYADFGPWEYHAKGW